jgi:di/tricarboxylate transporter
MAAVLVLGIVLVAMAMFASERVPLEVASLVLVLLLSLSGVLSPAEAFAGIANPTVIFIFTLLAMTQGLAATGVMQLAGRRAAFVRGFGERQLLLVLLLVVSAFSAFASNTAVAAAFLPVASAAAARAELPRSRVLLPMAYASMLGGMVLLFGSSTNLVVSEGMERLGLSPLGFAELAPVGLPVALLGIAWLVLATPALLPRREGTEETPALAKRQFVTEAALSPRSRLAGRPLSELGADLDLPILGLVREGSWIPATAPVPVRNGDRLVIRGDPQAILRVKDQRSLVLQAELSLPRETGPSVLAEVFVPTHSRLVGRTIRDFYFEERLGLRPLAVHRHPAMQSGSSPPYPSRSLADIRLAPGDVLLVSGPPGRLRELSGGELLVVLGSMEHRPPRYRKAVLAVGIFGVAVFLAGSRLVPAPVAGLGGMLAMIATRCMDAAEAFRVEWQIVLLIGSLLALGLAMEQSGAGALVARAIVPLAGWTGPRGVLFAVMLITVLLSAPMSNQAAALVVLPVAIHAAEQLGVDARPFAIATCYAASCSFITPLEPAAALVYGPGHYRFADFLRAGSPLTLLLLGVFTAAVPLVWPF